MEAAAATRPFDFADVLTRMADEHASDVHVTEGGNAQAVVAKDAVLPRGQS